VLKACLSAQTSGKWQFIYFCISVQPRLNDDIPSSDEVIRLKIGMSLNLTVNLIANPTPTTQWIFRRKGLIDQTVQRIVIQMDTNTHQRSLSKP
jgi:hypothetical protein